MLNIKDLITQAKASKPRLVAIIAALLALLIMGGAIIIRPSGGEEVIVNVEPAVPAPADLADDNSDGDDDDSAE
jgi:hypothetical protein